MKKINVNFSKPPQHKLKSLLKHYQTKQYVDAEKLSISITQEFPEHPFAWKVLGAALKQMGKINESLVASQKSIKFNPQDAEAHSNLSVTLKELGRLEEAEASLRKAIAFKPDYTEGHYNLGVTLKELGRLEEAEASYRRAIELKPEFSLTHNNLGVTLKELGRLDEAEASYRRAIELNPNYADAHNSLGVTLKELGRLDEAEASYRRAIELNPNYADAHSNLGNRLFDKGNLVEAIDCYKQALNIQPNHANAWHNIFFSIQAIKLQNPLIKNSTLLLGKQESSNLTQIFKSILNYHLNLGTTSVNNALNEVFRILSSDNSTFIKNPKIPSSELITELASHKKITALLHFGRSGTGLMHSLIDKHPEVSTLPSIYFSEFFDYFAWTNITVGGWEEMANRFVKTYAVLFNASSTTQIATKGNQFINNIGKKEGMMNVGKEKNEVLSVDKKFFVKELKQLMNCCDELNAFTFFKLVHLAYNKTLNDHNKKKLIFYHIHNPGVYAQLNFLRLAPNTNWLIMIREPIQSCESWIKCGSDDYDYKNIVTKIFQMLFEIDQAIFSSDNSIGIRLEDLKENPKKTIQALCDWLGIKEEESLYQMTAQGKKWWGDPTSPDYSKEGMDPFGKNSIERKLGSVFSKNDQFILQTLFYPFSVRFGYTEENLKKFKNDLKTIRPMLDQIFDFERKIIQNKKLNIKNFIKSGQYLYLRSGMIERWNTLNKFHTYPNMLKPLEIS